MIGTLLIAAVVLVGMVVFLAVTVFCANVITHYVRQRRDAVRPRRPINK